MLYARNRYMDDRRTLAHVIDLVMRDVHDRGLDAVSRAPRGDYAAFRRFELGAAINRLRTLKVRQERMG
jgi:hypothetical protein